MPYPLSTLKCSHALTRWTCADFLKLNNSLGQIVMRSKKVCTSPACLGVRAFQSCQGVWHYSWVFRVCYVYSEDYTQQNHDWNIHIDNLDLKFRTPRMRMRITCLFLFVKHFKSNTAIPKGSEKLEAVQCIGITVIRANCQSWSHFYPCGART